MSIAEKLTTIAENTPKVFNAGYEKGKAEVIPAKEEQEKTISITKNGTTEVLPDENKVLSKVKVEVNVPSSGGDYTNEQITSLIDRTITEFTIPYGTNRIGNSAFNGCTLLSKLNIPETVTKIGNYAFIGANNVQTEFPDSITEIGDGAFSSMYRAIITNLSLELKKIGDYAFQYNSAISFNEIPAKVETIGKQAFHSCTGLTELTFKGTPTSIATNAFQGCTNLLNIYVPWSEGEVANAPWSATNATIHYNSEV